MSKSKARAKVDVDVDVDVEVEVEGEGWARARAKVSVEGETKFLSLSLSPLYDPILDWIAFLSPQKHDSYTFPTRFFLGNVESRFLCRIAIWLHDSCNYGYSYYERDRVTKPMYGIFRNETNLNNLIVF